jgi:hypothetical protein
MKQVRKYTLKPQGHQYVEIERGYMELSVGLHGGIPALWAVIDPNEIEQVSMPVHIMETDRLYDLPNTAVFVGSVIMEDTAFHIFVE